MIRKSIISAGFLLTHSILLCSGISAQDNNSVHWLSFEQLEDSLSVHPKKVFIDFYTDWCAYCRKMDKVVFTKSEVIKLINDQYYAVRFDAETVSEITFGGQTFINDQVGKSRTPIHQIARLLASRNGQFTPPGLVVLDEKFYVKGRYFSYLDSQQLIKVLDP